MTPPLEEIADHPTLYMTVGVSGSGKSTWANAMKDAHPNNIRIVTMDDWRFACRTEFNSTDERIVKDANEFFIRQWLTAGYDVIVADTNISIKNRRRWAQVAKSVEQAGYPINVKEIWFDVPLETCIARVHSRVQEGGHDVPDMAIRSQYENMQRQK